MKRQGNLHKAYSPDNEVLEQFWDNFGTSSSCVLHADVLAYSAICQCYTEFCPSDDLPPCLMQRGTASDNTLPVSVQPCMSLPSASVQGAGSYDQQS